MNLHQDKPERCERCQGSGRYLDMWEVGRGRSRRTESDEIDCPWCAGSGEIRDRQAREDACRHNDLCGICALCRLGGARPGSASVITSMRATYATPRAR